MTYSGELVMPTRYVEVAEDEMMYLDGGLNLGMSRTYLNKNTCRVQARNIIRQRKWTRITVEQLTREIYAHAFVYYYLGKALKSINTSTAHNIYRSASQVQVENAVDSRQWAFNIIWGIPL